MKTDLDQVEALVSHFDCSVNEQCQEYNECDMLQPFIKAGKPVLNAEYQKAKATALCAAGLRTLVLPLRGRVGEDQKFPAHGRTPKR